MCQTHLCKATPFTEKNEQNKAPIVNVLYFVYVTRYNGKIKSKLGTIE